MEWAQKNRKNPVDEYFQIKRVFLNEWKADFKNLATVMVERHLQETEKKMTNSSSSVQPVVVHFWT